MQCKTKMCLRFCKFYNIGSQKKIRTQSGLFFLCLVNLLFQFPVNINQAAFETITNNFAFIVLMQI